MLRVLLCFELRVGVLIAVRNRRTEGCTASAICGTIGNTSGGSVTKPKLRSAVLEAVKHRPRTVEQIFADVLDDYGSVPRAKVVNALEALKKARIVLHEPTGWVRK